MNDSMKLPPLPDGELCVHGATTVHKNGEYFTDGQMRDYARAAIALAQPAGDAVAVGIGFVGRDGQFGASALSALGQLPPGEHRLYTTPPAAASDARDAAAFWRDVYDRMAYQLYLRMGNDHERAARCAKADVESREREFAALTQEQPNG